MLQEVVMVGAVSASLMVLACEDENFSRAILLVRRPVAVTVSASITIATVNALETFIDILRID